MLENGEAGIRSEKVRIWVRRGASALILAQLLFVATIPNANTYLGSRLLPYFAPYGNALELVSNWNFFAPDPGPPPFYVEWEVALRDPPPTEGRGLASAPPAESTVRGWFPSPPRTANSTRVRKPSEDGPVSGEFFLRERLNRRIASARFMANGEGRINLLLAPYLCATIPGAASVRFWKVSWTTPPLQDVASGTRAYGDDVASEKKVLGQVGCDEAIASSSGSARSAG